MTVPFTRRVRIAAATTMALALMLSGCAADPTISFSGPEQVDAPLPEETQTQLNDAITHAMAASGASGAIVGVWVPWSGSWVAGLGTQNGTTPVDESMIFRVGDVTRLMTCDVLYALADRGIVKVDDSISKYVSGTSNLADATLLDLCNGTAGTGSSSEILMGSWLQNPQRHWGPKELASAGMDRNAIAPGVEYRDSDAGYMLLGLALERASGMTAQELIEEYVAGPLALEKTRLPGWQAVAPASKGALKGHYMPPAEEGGLNCAAPVDITVSSASIGFTDSGVVSNITDLGRYAQAQAAQALRLKQKPERYGNPRPAYPDAPSWLQATGGAVMVGSMVGQNGWAPGYLTATYSDPTTGFTVAVVLNNSSAGTGMVSALAWELAAIASKAAPADGQTAPEFGLPFTAEQYHEQIATTAICPIEPPVEEAPPADDGEESAEG